jgi:hypothetical protein
MWSVLKQETGVLRKSPGKRLNLLAGDPRPRLIEKQIEVPGGNCIQDCP